MLVAGKLYLNREMMYPKFLAFSYYITWEWALQLLFMSVCYIDPSESNSLPENDFVLNIYQVNRNLVIVTCEGQVYAVIEDCAILGDNKFLVTALIQLPGIFSTENTMNATVQLF